jgi:histidine triad (HIT) family protein
MNADCLFCAIVAGKIPATVIGETETTLAFRDISPQARVHFLVVPKVHHEDALALAVGDPQLLADLTTTAVEVAKNEGIFDSGYRIVFNTGDDARRTVFHAHMHVLGGELLAGFGKHGSEH